MSASRRREGRTTGNSRRRTRGGRSPVPPRPQGAARCAWPCPCRSRRRPRRPACRARPCRPRERRRRCPIRGRTRPPSSSSSSSSSRRGHRERVCAARIASCDFHFMHPRRAPRTARHSHIRFDTHDIVPSRVTLVFPILHRPSRRIALALLVATRVVSNHSSRARYSHFTPSRPAWRLTRRMR